MVNGKMNTSAKAASLAMQRATDRQGRVRQGWQVTPLLGKRILPADDREVPTQGPTVRQPTRFTSCQKCKKPVPPRIGSVASPLCRACSSK
jgi:hypothetical protein